MRGLRPLAAELHKTLTLPSTWVALAVTILGTAAITVLNANYARSAIASGDVWDRGLLSPFETGYSGMPLGTVGAVVLGVVAIGSEYTAASTDAGGGRQITTTLAAMPGRTGVLLAKTAVVVLLVALSAAVAIPLSTGIAAVMLGDAAVPTPGFGEAAARSAGAALYWALTAVMAIAITALARTVMIPLVVLIANSSVVSVSILLSRVTPLAFWLPDAAGQRLFGDLSMMEGALDAGPGGLVMAAWAALLLGIAAVVFARRDA
ncbi:ABC transporter permease [Leucobacter sp. wl10]|uniref:ABC transporter permease n=1 Tax=Leucobacter sp. wl10 TaxID=2304677 RepID=UPI000E5A172C|nr:ABC transporter permease [Leucobacter sp. wl10]RGE22414.1 ABC transporter permease [Leucobacter sp. wl10]